RERQDPLAAIADAVQLRRDHDRARGGHPADRARQERRFAAAGEGADDDRFDRATHDEAGRGAPVAVRQRADERGERAIPRAEEHRDRQRDDAAEPQRRDRAERQGIDAVAGGAAEDGETEALKKSSVHALLSIVVETASTMWQRCEGVYFSPGACTSSSRKMIP